VTDVLSCPGCESCLCPDCGALAIPLFEVEPAPHRLVPVPVQDRARPTVKLEPGEEFL